MRWGSAVTAVSRPVRISVLVAVFLVSSVFVFAPDVQAATFWRSTLTIKRLKIDASGGVVWEQDHGCHPCDTALSDRTFEINSVTYTVTAIRESRTLRMPGYEGQLGHWVYRNGQPFYQTSKFGIAVTPVMPASAWRGLVLSVGSVGFALDEARVTDSAERGSTSFEWFDPGITWRRNQRVSLQIKDEAAAPHAPRSLTFKPGNGTLTLRWQQPKYTGGAAISRYEYRHKSTGAFPSSWTRVADGPDADSAAGNERSVTVSGLTNGTDYTFELRAVNSAGAGATASAADSPNTLPTSSDHTVTIPEEMMYAFQPSDWNFSDGDSGDSLRGIILENDVPADAGTLYTVVRGPRGRGHFDRNEFRSSDGGFFLFFRPQPNFNGNNYARFRFRVTDGKDPSDAIYTMTINVTPVNDKATGRPTISGTRQQGQVLTASSGDMADVDGLPASFDYQWLRLDPDGTSNPVAITGATARTHTLTPADVGKRLRVRLSFTDGDGHSEELTSGATGVVQSQGTVNVAPTSSNATVRTNEDTDYTFGASDFGFSDANPGDVMTSVTLETLPSAGEILLDGAAVPAGVAVLIDDIDDGKLVFRPAPDANGTNYASFTFKVSDGTVDSAPANTITVDVAQVNDPATGRLRVTFVPWATPSKHKLDTSIAEIADVDGMTDAIAGNRFTYERILAENGETTELSNEKDFVFWPNSYRTGSTIRWKVSFTDDGGNVETFYSDPVFLVRPTLVTLEQQAQEQWWREQDRQTQQTQSQTQTEQAQAPTIVGAPQISDAPESGRWAPGDKVEVSVTFSERMTVLAYRGVPSIGLMLGGTEERTAEYDRGNSWDTLVFAYTLTNDDGSHDSMMVPADSLALNDGVIQSRETRVGAALTHAAAAVLAPPTQPTQQGEPRGSGEDPQQQEAVNTPAAGAPTIAGTAQVGETLTADTSGITDADGMTNATFSYQWTANDGSTGTAIADATGSTYTPSASDQGKTLEVTVTFTDDAGNNESLTSAETPAVTGSEPQQPQVPPAPTELTATASSDGHVVLDWEAPADDSVTGYVILRRRPTEGENTLTVYEEDTASTDTTYTDTDVTAEIQHVYRVKAINAAGQSSWSNYANATPQQPQDTPQEVPPAPTELTATASSDGHVVLDWEAPADDSVTGYVILRRRPTEGENTLTVYEEDTQSTDTTYTDTDVTAGIQHVYRVKAINAAGPSGWSNYANATPQQPQVPPAPTNLTATASSDGHVVLDWEAPADDSVTGYVILRRRPTEGENTLTVHVEDTASTDTTYTDTDVTAGIQHVYRVKAINAAGQSSWSNYANATPQE